jgi:hypothetical protein
MTQTVEDTLKLVKLALVSIADEVDATKSQQLAKEVLAVVQEATKVTTKFTVPKQWQVELADELSGDVRLVAPCGEAWRFRNTDGSDAFVQKFLISILAEKGNAP